MGDRMRPVPFEELMERIFSEYRNHGTIFGISRTITTSFFLLRVEGLELRVMITQKSEFFPKQLFIFF